jgi:hypothetical protein
MLRSGSVDRPGMGASSAGSYEVTPPGRSRASDATHRADGSTQKQQPTREACGGSDPTGDATPILTGLRHSDAKGRGTVWNPGRLELGARRPERSAIGTEQEEGIRSRLPALVKQQQTEQMSAAALRPGRPSGRATAVGS